MQRVHVVFKSAMLVIVTCAAIHAQTASPAAQPQPEINKYMPVAYTLRIIRTELQHAERPVDGQDCGCVFLPFDNIKVSRDGFEFRASGKAPGGCWKCFSGPCDPSQPWSTTMHYQFSTMVYRSPNGSRVYLGGEKLHSWCQRGKKGYERGEDIDIWWKREQDARDFAAAVNRMIWEQLPEATQFRQAQWAEFQQKAGAWHDAGSKAPEFPDDVRREKLLAEDALKEKNFESAVQHYETGLHIQPLWPDAWFNVALIYGEMHDFGDAADRMKHYVELMPNAPDAAAARDKILLWEAKEKDGSSEQ